MLNYSIDFRRVIFNRFLEATEAMLAKDISDNKAIGKHGAEAIIGSIHGDSPLRILTHCNTGSLATAG